MDASLPVWQRHLASTVYVLFYVLMIGMPLSGWILNSASPYKITLFGLLPWPNLPVIPELADETKKLVHDAAGEAHETSAYIFAGLIMLHWGAALYHHFIRRDDTAIRMAPGFMVGVLNKLRGGK